jgi:hypothetical protein
VDVSIQSCAEGLTCYSCQVAGDEAAFVFNDPKWIHEAIESARFFGGAGGLSSTSKLCGLNGHYRPAAGVTTAAAGKADATNFAGF